MKVKAKFDRLTVSDPKVKARGQSTLVSGFCHTSALNILRIDMSRLNSFESCFTKNDDFY